MYVILLLIRSLHVIMFCKVNYVATYNYYYTLNDWYYSKKTLFSIKCVVFELIEQLPVTYVNLANSILYARWL